MRPAYIAFLFGFIFLALSLYGIQLDQRLKTWGVTTDVTKSNVVSTKSSRGTRYKIFYTFTTQDGKTFESSASLPEESVPGPLKVVYLPYDPEVNSLTYFTYTGFYGLLIAALAVLGLGVYLQKRYAQPVPGVH